MKKIIYFIIAFIVVINFAVNFFVEDEREIPVVKEPKQYNLSQKQINKLKYVRKYGDWNVLMLPLAHYEISARVLHERSYIFGLDAAVSPHDIGVAWGALEKDENFKQIEAYHGNRFLYTKWRSDFFSYDFINTHTANIHIVPKDNKILKKIRRIRRGDYIYLKGYLLKAEGLNMKNGQQYSRVSSLTRNDSGNGACETMYVTDVIYHHKKNQIQNKK